MPFRRFVAAAAAAGLLLSACSKDPATVKREHMASGNAYFAAGEYSKAIIEYRNVVQADPTDGDARRRLGDAYMKAGDPANAYREYIRAADLLPDDLEVQLTAAGFRLVARQFEDARSAADRVLQKDPSNVRALIIRANAIAGLENVDEAVQGLEEALKLEPDSSELYTNLGGLELKRDRLAAAESAFQQATKADPKSSRAHSALGNFYWSTQRWREAEAEFKKAIELDPSDALANRALATLYISTGRKADAAAPLETLARTANTVAARLTVADYYLLSDRADEGVKLLEAIAKERDGLLPARSRLAALAYSRQKHEEAHRIVDELLAKFPGNAQLQTLKGRFLLAEQKYDEALQLAQSATKADPRSAPAFFLLGEVQAARRNNADAIKAYTEVLQLNPRAAAAQAQLSRLQLAAGDTSGSVRSAQSAVQAAPHAPEARLILARALAANGDFSAAERELTDLQRAFPADASVQSLLGTVYVGKKDYARARSAYQRAYDKDQTSLDALSGLVGLDLQAGKGPDARSRIEAQVARTPNSGPVLILAARTYAALHDAPKAEGSLRRAIEADPSDLTAFSMLGQLLYSQGRLEDGRVEFEKLLAHDPKSSAAGTMLGIILERQGKREEAKKRYEQVLAANPRAAVAANNLAWRYAEDGERLDLALQLAQTAVANMPDEPELKDTLGWIYQKRGLPKQAVSIHQQTVKAKPDNAVYRFHLGAAYAAAGDTANARKTLQQALAMKLPEPEAARARQLLEGVQ